MFTAGDIDAVIQEAGLEGKKLTSQNVCEVIGAAVRVGVLAELTLSRNYYSQDFDLTMISVMGNGNMMGSWMKSTDLLVQKPLVIDEVFHVLKIVHTKDQELRSLCE